MTTYSLKDLPMDIQPGITVNPFSGCWEWMPRRNAGGYGCVFRDGSNHLVHRLVYALLVDQIPEGFTIDHVKDRGCLSKACCWPVHLEPVTRGENSRRSQRDTIQRRRARGTELAVLTGTQVVWATEVYRNSRRLLDKVEREQAHVTIKRYDEDTAVIVPVAWYRNALAIQKGVRAFTHDTDGHRLPNATELPVGELMSAIGEAAIEELEKQS